ncbi:REP-associated tyrosine transposase [Loktanella salsilacus]|uniref:REP-associated tyrosine transposase n=1 Tax=Loktanella salsilacus TaxID=195913 RepID=UPI0037495E96
MGQVWGMVNSGRRVLPGTGTYFFTVRLADPASDFLTRHIELLRLSTRMCQIRYPFEIGDGVALPDRMHVIWTLPPGDDNYLVRWQSIRSTFARHVPLQGHHTATMAIWQRRVWNRRILTQADLAECRSLIYDAPVQAGLVEQSSDWPYSTTSQAYMRDRSGGSALLHVIEGGR